MDHIQDLRKKVLRDADLSASRPRFGLFSHPPPARLADDSGYKTKIHPRDQSGKPVLQAANIKVGGNKGTYVKDLFSHASSINGSGEKYLDPVQNKKLFQSRFYQAQHKHQYSFKPASCYKALASGPYPHVDLNEPSLNPRRFRNAEGRVTAGSLKNITTSSHGSITKRYFKDYQYQSNNINPKAQQKKASNDPPPHSQPQPQTLQRKEPFCSAYGKSRAFSADKDIYYQTQSTNKTIVQAKKSVYAHEQKFKPTGRRSSEAFGKFPQFMNEKKELIRQDLKASEKKQSFKSFSCQKSKPCPSITRLNIRLH